MVRLAGLMMISSTIWVACAEEQAPPPPDAMPSIASREECLATAVGTWRVRGTITRSACTGSGGPIVWDSQLTISVADRFGQQVVGLYDDRLGSSSNVRDRPTVLYADGECTISGAVVDGIEAYTTIGFAYRSATHATLHGNTLYAGCSTPFTLVADR
jgi:hypothetical protein